jgi:hypothetical protein
MFYKGLAVGSASLVVELAAERGQTGASFFSNLCMGFSRPFQRIAMVADARAMLD